MQETEPQTSKRHGQIGKMTAANHNNSSVVDSPKVNEWKWRKTDWILSFDTQRQTIEKNQTSGTCDIWIEIKMTMNQMEKLYCSHSPKGE